MPKFKVGDMVTRIGQDEIGMVDDVLHEGTEPLYSIKCGNGLRWARDNELEMFFARPVERSSVHTKDAVRVVTINLRS